MPLDIPKYTNIPTYKNTIKLLNQEPDILPLLERIIQWEEEIPKKNPAQAEIGFRAEEVFGDPRTVAKLVPRGILRLSYKSSSDTRYRALNLGELKRAVEDWKKRQAMLEEEESAEIPEDLFQFIVGHKDIKELLWRAIHSEQPIHILLTGVPSSAKSLFLEELRRLPKSTFVLGSGLSKAGLYDILFDEQPKYLVIDEIDKVDSTENLTCLLSLMERGIVVERKHRKHRSIQLKTWVFAGANRLDKLPPELKSRFLILHFRPYTPEEFTEVVVHILTAREKIPKHLALYIAQKCLKELYTRDPRDAVKIARLAKTETLTKHEIDKIINLIKQRR